MTLSKKLAVAKDIHLFLKIRGWHQKEYNVGEQMKLTMSETNEALQAHRKGHLVEYSSFNKAVKSSKLKGTEQQVFWVKMFQRHMKDRVEVELADVLIRLWGFLYGHFIINMKMTEAEVLEIFPVVADQFSKVTWGTNFATNLLLIDKKCIEVYDNDSANKYTIYLVINAIQTVEHFCESCNIDVYTLLRKKLTYNQLNALVGEKSTKKY